MRTRRAIENLWAALCLLFVVYDICGTIYVSLAFGFQAGYLKSTFGCDIPLICAAVLARRGQMRTSVILGLSAIAFLLILYMP